MSKRTRQTSTKQPEREMKAEANGKKQEQEIQDIAEDAAEKSAAGAEDELERLKRQLQEAEEKFIRSRADLDNYRKRVQREAAEVRQYTKVSTVEQFLPVFDHFQMAMRHVDENSDFATLKQGMDMILKEFSRTFENLGVDKVDAVGEEFDPGIHEAMAQEPSESVPLNHVIRQWKCGYRIGDRLLRPATVVVSSGPPEENSESNKSA